MSINPETDNSQTNAETLDIYSSETTTGDSTEKEPASIQQQSLITEANESVDAFENNLRLNDSPLISNAFSQDLRVKKT
jgi:hypothetical protein